jgi:hypothetical protein
MRILGKRFSLFFIVVCTVLLSAFIPHKFYVTTTSLRFVESNNSFQITSRLFIEDIESILVQSSIPDLKLAPDNDESVVDSLLTNYFEDNLIFTSVENEFKINFLGKEYKDDMMVCYLELKFDKLDENINIQNTLLFDFSEEQKNIIHYRNGNQRKSFLFTHTQPRFKIKLNPL